MKLKSAGKPYNIELGLISKLIETKDMKTINDKDIKSLFFTGEHRRVFVYIQTSFNESGEIPTPRILKQKFNYELETYSKGVGTEESLTYWCDEIRKKTKHNKLADIIENTAEILNGGDTEKAYSELKKGVWYIEGEIVESDTIDITDTKGRKEAYLERKRNKGMLGIPTGIPHLDYLTKGLVNGELTTIIATTGVGKTWFIIYIACYAQLQGYKVLLLLTEMSKEVIRDRCEAMTYGMMCGEFDYNKFKSGSLEKEQEEKYFEFLDEDLPHLEHLMVDYATGVSSVTANINQYKPDIVLIDGAYLMEDERGAKDDWLRVTHITRDLKQLSKNRNIPIVINSQADQNTSKKTGPGLGDIKYSQSIGQDSDNIIALYRDSIMISDDEMGVKLLKQREGILGSVIMNWNFKKMNFKSIFSETENSFEESEESDTNTSIIGVN